MNNVQIGRFLLKDYLSFDNVELDFSSQKNGNLILFTGSSGAGKSILMKSIVSLFGFSKDILSSYGELEICNKKLPLKTLNLMVKAKILLSNVLKMIKLNILLMIKLFLKKIYLILHLISSNIYT